MDGRDQGRGAAGAPEPIESEPAEAALERHLRAALFESRQRYKDLVEISSDFAWETDAAGRFVFVSSKSLPGWPVDALVGRDSALFLSEPGLDNAFAAQRPLEQAEVWVRTPLGEIVCLSVSAVPLLDADGRFHGTRGVGRDLTDERRRDAALAHVELRDRLFTHLVRAIRDELDPAAALAAAVRATALALGAAGGVVLRGSGEAMAAAASWGQSAAPAAVAAARTALESLDETALEIGDCQVIAHAARYRQVVEGAILLWRDRFDGGFPEGDRAILADVADQLGVVIAQVAQHEHMLALSHTDPLTGLLNRRAFFAELERRLRRLQHADAGAAQGGMLAYLDLDNFKLVNDNRGHRAGDEAIRATCRILGQMSRSGDLVARLGGDEFALWLEGLSPETALARAQALSEASRALAPLTADPTRPLSCSIGLALVAAGAAETPEHLVARADAAMYHAKQAGKGRVEVAPP